MSIKNVLAGFILVMMISTAGFTQEEKEEEPKYGWDNKFIGTLNLAQTALSNWTQGGENSWSWQVDINGSFINKQEHFSWSNTIKLLYGETKLGGDDPKKTTDEIFFETVYTRIIWPTLNPYVAATALTQFNDGYDYSTDPASKISKFLDPGYFRESIGIDYSPADNFKTRLGFALKQTIADVYAARWSDDPETIDEVENLRNEIGMESVTDYNLKLSELIIYVTKLELFSNIKRIDEIDVRWDNVFSAKVADYLAVSFNFKLFYDKDVSLKRQLYQTLAVGLSYSFL
jgi:hypothetical protein